MRVVGRIAVLALLLAATPSGAAETAWARALDGLRGRLDALAADLDRAHAALLGRARVEDAALVGRLLPEPPRPRPAGYGNVPEIETDPPLAVTKPLRRTYALAQVATWCDEGVRDGTALERRIAQQPPAALEPLVAEFERLRDWMRMLERHLAYHAGWQRSVADHSAYFAVRNELLPVAEELRAVLDSGGDTGRATALRRRILDAIAPFRPTPGLAVRAAGDGTSVLRVRVTTDIDDTGFLAAFREAVEQAYAEAARASGLRVELEFARVTAQQLYPDGAPAKGARIDIDAHLARFGAGTLVLTTGAETTHARTGWAVLLGPQPTARRTLAHEFGHLLGFEDAYLRGYEGTLDDPHGVVLVEWTGLTDDLMGNPGGGAVTPEMMRTLIEAYGNAEAAGRAGLGVKRPFSSRMRALCRSPVGPMVRRSV